MRTNINTKEKTKEKEEDTSVGDAPRGHMNVPFPPELHKKRIVTIGGGTGSFAVLSGLRRFAVDLTAVVSMADDGGSTGVLRDELGVLPPGDIRQCLVALSPASNELRDLMNYRFSEGPFKGHTWGNILLSTLEKQEGSFLRAVEKASVILQTQGETLPSTGEDARLALRLSDGSAIFGEDAIEQAEFQNIGVESLYYDPPVAANPKAVERIREADVIIIGPGTFYSGVLPNLIFPEIAEAVNQTKAKVVVPINLTNKKGHTSGFSVEDYIAGYERYIGEGRVDLVLVNTHNPADHLLKRYQEQEGEGALVTFRDKTLMEDPARRTYRIVTGDFIKNGDISFDQGDLIAHTRSFIRHDPAKLARVILYLTEFEGKYSVE